MITAARLWVLAGFFTLGIYSGGRFQVSPLTVPLGLLGLLLLLAGWALHKSPNESPFVPLRGRTAAMVLVGAALIGVASSSMRLESMRSSPVDKANGPAYLRGLVRADPVPYGRSMTLLVDVEQLDGKHSSGRVEIRLYEQAEVRLGDRIRVGAVLSPLKAGDDFDRRKMFRSIAATGHAFTKVGVEQRSSNRLLRFAEHTRSSMRRLAVASLGRGRAGLLLGITIGDETLIPKKSSDEFRSSGLSHLTAVSGANVAMVLASALWLLQIARVSRWARAIVSLVVILLFTLVTRWEPSVLRASVVAAAAITAFFFGRRATAVNSLAIAYLVLLAVDPLLLWSVGFQLSFAATAGILLMGEPLAGWMGRYLPSAVASAAAVTLAAQAAVTPLFVVHFRQVSSVSLPANLLAFPLVAPATIVGFVGAGIGAVWSAGGQAILWIAGPFLSGLQFVAHAFGSQSYSTIRIDDGIELARLMLLYALAVGIVLFLRGNRRAFKRILLACICAWMVTFVAPVAGHPSPTNMRITFFDVGQGDAALIETPAGAKVLIDGGPSGSGVATDLRRAGITRLDLVVLSHGHADHVNGLEDVVERISVGMIWYSGVIQGVPAAIWDKDPSAPEEGTVTTIGDLRIEVLAPSRELVAAAGGPSTGGPATKEGSPVNDASFVLRVSYGAACALFTGDIEEIGQGELVDNDGDSIRCALLKAPHHGSARLEESFVKAVDPQVVSISVGPNDYGHPTRTALTILQREGAQVVRTDLLGDTVIEMDAKGGWRFLDS